MIPTLARHQPRARSDLDARVDHTLGELLGERPDLQAEVAKALKATSLDRGPTLHLDDQSGIDLANLGYDWSYLQDRARVRAEDGDLVAASHAPAPGYEAYCRDYLGLGTAVWLTPAQPRHRSHLANHCWTDREVRHQLVHLLRADELRSLHPLMGSRETWQLARLLRQRARRPLQVIAPPPALTKWVNDKIEFAGLIRRLFGERWLPTTRACSSLAMLSRELRDLADQHRVLSVKLPDAAGGGGNVVIPSGRVRGRSLAQIHADLRGLLRTVGWRGRRRLLVGAWESEVLSAPSGQLWIPLDPDPPVVEGVFEQILEGVTGEFVGCQTSGLPDWIVDEIVDRCWALGRLFQRLGYVGRCSFDLVVVGTRWEQSRLEFIECNGRWGGTSLPMTLVSRLRPAAAHRPYIVRSLNVPPSCRVELPDVLDELADLLFDVRTEQGDVVLFNPSKIRLRGGVKLIVFGETVAEARGLVEEEIRGRLRSLVDRSRAVSSTGGPRSVRSN